MEPMELETRGTPTSGLLTESWSGLPVVLHSKCLNIESRTHINILIILAQLGSETHNVELLWQKCFIVHEFLPFSLISCAIFYLPMWDRLQLSQLKTSRTISSLSSKDPQLEML